MNYPDPETEPAPPQTPRSLAAQEASATPVASSTETEPWETRILLEILLGPQGLRAGWSVLLFTILFFLFFGVAGMVLAGLNLIDPKDRFTASASLFSELAPFLGMVAAAAIVALVERRRGNLLAFNLTGPRSLLHFLEGLVAGFAALSVLIGALAWGGWLHFGPIALSGSQILKFAALWAIAFLLVGCVEEGIFRCYLQFTLTRGINFWWALGIVGSICLVLFLTGKGNGIWGVYILAGLGLVPCLLLHLNKTEGSSFWQAAWVTSTLFGYIHTSNNGENWIGIFAAAAIGFTFVVSVRVTGSAGWAIGCHASWDWAETYFYGAADSGNVASGHYLTTTPAGPAFWSGGSDGPEGSVLVLGAILLLLIALVVLYGRREPTAVAASATELAAG
ncbi:MAG TPA: CPBP family intramembrane glutamic endopeptidase [Terracidiphilus sp.]|jgi:membrane protease YdiL (CAAX protease family)|nr:CPBP family intramembrane glutamic endopeptidase [Terracidiphilus sp.]